MQYHKQHVAFVVCMCIFAQVSYSRASLASQLLDTLKRLIQSNCHCSPYNCCSKWGYCGHTDAYCGDGCQSGPCLSSSRRIQHSAIITREIFACSFPLLDDDQRANLYQDLTDAMIATKWRPTNAVEAAIFLAHISYFTHGLTTFARSCSSTNCKAMNRRVS
jgi:hypothetical protein